MRLLVRTVGGESVKSVRDRNHARQQRNLVAFQSVRVSASIQRLVVEFDSGQHLSQLRHRTQEGAEVMIEPPGDLGRGGVLEIHDGVFVAVEVALVEPFSSI